MPDQPIKHGHQHRFKGPDAIGIGQYEIKLFPDETIAELLGITSENAVVAVGTNLFEFMIPEDLHGSRLRYCDAYLSVVSAMPIKVAVRNVTQDHDLLETEITIDPGEYTSASAAVPPVCHQGLSAECAYGDLIALDVTAGGDGRGLGVVLEFSV